MPRPSASWASTGTNTEQTARMLGPSGRCSPSARTRCSSTATRTRRWPAASPPRQARVPVAHVEAGMRSFDRAMPEELNRVLNRPPADLLLCPRRRVANLARERAAGRVELVGDVMVDVALLFQPRARGRRAAAPRRRRAARTCSRPRTAPATSTTRSACGAARRPAAGDAPRRRPAAAPADARAPGGAGLLDRLAGAGREPAPRRWATSSSPRCCAARARSSPTRAACRRRPTSPACRA